MKYWLFFDTDAHMLLARFFVYGKQMPVVRF
jgi:hypothetical protein